MPDELLQINGVELALRRPGNRARGLRGWDAADELLLEQASACLQGLREPRVLIVDDQFSALTLGLSRFSPVTLADSATLGSALVLNAASSMPFSVPVSWTDPPRQTFDLVVLRIPRQVDYLAWLLRWVNQVLKPDGCVVAGGMIKHLPDRSAQMFSELVTTRTVCPARRKARVVIAGPGQSTLEGWGDQWQGYNFAGSNVQLDALPAATEFWGWKPCLNSQSLTWFSRMYPARRCSVRDAIPNGRSRTHRQVFFTATGCQMIC